MTGTVTVRNRIAVVTDVRPVLPPSDTPDALSTNVVVVDVPRTAPAVVAIASARSAPLIRGSFPSLSSISALEEHSNQRTDRIKEIYKQECK